MPDAAPASPMMHAPPYMPLLPVGWGVRAGASVLGHACWGVSSAWPRKRASPAAALSPWHLLQCVRVKTVYDPRASCTRGQYSHRAGGVRITYHMCAPAPPRTLNGTCLRVPQFGYHSLDTGRMLRPTCIMQPLYRVAAAADMHYAATVPRGSCGRHASCSNCATW